MKVKIQNFQSIEEAELEIDGFTVIVGRSNIGKSAVVRAIEGALNNKQGDFFVRNGAKYTQVELECPEIHLQWKKGGGFNDYVINGEVLESVGLGAPPHVAEAGFRDLEVNKQKIPVQVASQWSPVFLLDPSKTTGSASAEIISDIGRLSEVQTALRKCGKDRRNLDTTCRVREKDLDQTRIELEDYEGFESDENRVKALGPLRDEISELSREIEVLESIVVLHTEVLEEMRSLADLEDLSVPDWEGEELLAELSSAVKFAALAASSESVINRYSGLDSVFVPDPDFDRDLKEYGVWATFKDHAESARLKVDSLVEVETFRVPTIDDDVTSDWIELERVLDSYRDEVERVPKLKTEVTELDAEIDTAHEEIHDLLLEAGECPLCGSEVEQ